MSAHYDAIVVGGGHHGTIIAAYLGAAGLKTAVFERRAQFGGGATSRNGPAAGFRMNICAHWTRFYGHPAYRDFDLGAEGLSYVFPEGNEGIVFEDGSSYIGYSAYRVVDAKTGRTEFAQDNVDKTYRQIQRFSQADADTYLEFLDKYTKYWKPAREMTTPRSNAIQADAAGETCICQHHACLIFGTGLFGRKR